MYPLIPYELVADPFRSAELILGNSGLEDSSLLDVTPCNVVDNYLRKQNKCEYVKPCCCC
jgi:hypothetical protein